MRLSCNGGAAVLEMEAFNEAVEGATVGTVPEAQ